MDKEQQIEEIAKIICNTCREKHISVSKNCKCKIGEPCFVADIHSEALYNAGYRKVSESEAELQELNIKYYNEAKDLRRELAKAKSENEKRLKANEDFATKHCRMKCEIAKMRVKEFAERVKNNLFEKVNSRNVPYDDFTKENAVVLLLDDLLKEYEK